MLNLYDAVHAAVTLL